MAIMAVEDINNNPNILPSHKLMLDIQDGQCEADIVMKKFIDFIKNKDPARFRRTVGILGELIRYNGMRPGNWTSIYNKIPQAMRRY